MAQYPIAEPEINDKVKNQTDKSVQEEKKPLEIIEALHPTKESNASSESRDHQINDSSEDAVESTSRATIDAGRELHRNVEQEVPVAKEHNGTEGAESSEPVRVTNDLVKLSALPIQEAVPYLKKYLPEETSPRTPTLNQESPKTNTETEDTLSPVERAQEEIRPPEIIEAFHPNKESEISTAELRSHQINNSTDNSVESSSTSTGHAGQEPYSNAEQEITGAKKEDYETQRT
ncbi:unnamed protein product, partial [Enterobius vermicularis]|uniref:Uncharacterized protein n=1 Tax=Enterobius vermicularis TaxID=51028 RepID=A0A0N4UU25_ENTVE